MNTITNNKKNITLAKYAGFCYGVKRAVETTKKLKAENNNKEVCVLGELIHNSQVIKELEDLGIKTYDILPENGSGVCVIRSHGASFQVVEEIKNKGFEPFDLTCPDVKKVQNKAIELVKNGYFLIILGSNIHPEVIAIRENAISNSNSEMVYVAQNLEDIKAIEEKIKEVEKVGLVVQTTQKSEFLDEVVKYLTPITKDLKVENTICQSTKHRQEEAKELAKNNDLMIVVGSKKSANTTHLAEILVQITKTIHIEKAEELKEFENEINSAKNIGVTAGASTPDYIINEVINVLKGE